MSKCSWGKTLNPKVSLKASVFEYTCEWMVLATVVSFYCAPKVNDSTDTDAILNISIQISMS